MVISNMSVAILAVIITNPTLEACNDSVSIHPGRNGNEYKLE